MQKSRITVAELPCAIGKSVLLILIAYALRERGFVNQEGLPKILIMVPTHALLWQMYKYCQKDVGSFQDLVDGQSNLNVILFSDLTNLNDDSLKNTIVLIDEGHDLPMDGNKNLKSASKILSLSATCGSEGHKLQIQQKIFEEKDVQMVDALGDFNK